MDVTGDCPTSVCFFSNASFLISFPVFTTFISKFILNLFVRSFVPPADCCKRECNGVTRSVSKLRLNETKRD